MVVDTGATYTVLPETLWRDLGIVPTRTVRAKLANGEFVYRDLGDADLAYEGRRTRTWVLLGKDGDVPLLGAYSLEGLGLEVDPINQNLRAADIYLLAARLAAPTA